MPVKINPSSFIKIILSAASILFYSCEYSPSETNYHDIKIGEPNVVFTVLEEDKFNILRGEIIISYERILNEHKLLDFKLYVDQYEQGWGYAGTNAIKFDSRGYNDGHHSLRLDLIVSTNSGSLADRTGAEAFIISKSYGVYIFNDDVNVPNITEAAPENGSLKIKWEQYTQPAFGKYIVNKNGNKIAEISSVNQNYFYDNTYAGGRAVYRIDMDILGSLFTGYGKEKEIDMPAVPAVFSEVVNDYSLRVSWERTPFDSAFKSYIIGKGFGEEIIINNIDSTSWLDENPAFNGGIIYLNIEPKTGERSNFPPVYNGEKIGKPFNYYSNYAVKFLPEKNWFVIYNRNSIVRYNAESLTIIDSIVTSSALSASDEYCMDVSSDGEQLYIISDFTYVINKYNISTQQEEGNIDLREILPLSGGANAISLSDDNKLVIYTGFASQQKLRIIDASTETYLAYIPVSHATGHLKITDNGKYIIHGFSLYKFENNSLTESGMIVTGGAFPVFIDDERCLSYENGYLKIFSNETLGLINQIYVEPYGNAYSLCYDESTGYAGVETGENGRYYICNIESGELKKTISIGKTGNYFQNGFLFGNGRYMPVHLN